MPDNTDTTNTDIMQQQQPQHAQSQPPADTGEPHGDPAPDTIDWKAQARKWEKLAKANHEKAEQADQLQAQLNKLNAAQAWERTVGKVSSKTGIPVDVLNIVKADSEGKLTGASTIRQAHDRLWELIPVVPLTWKCASPACWKHGNISATFFTKRRNPRKHARWAGIVEIQEEPQSLAALEKWSCGELNPGPVTVPSVFYVRSLLAVRQFFCPHRCRRQLMASISAEKVPQPPCGAMAGASLLNDAQHLPEDEGE